MKTVIFMLATLVVSVYVDAQLGHTKWKGAIKGDNPQGAIFKFSKDTLVLYAVADGSVIETMACKMDDKTFTVIKSSGQSDCDTVTPGKYKFEINAGVIDVYVLSDNCGDRSSALDKTSWVKVKY
jgi:hypothetical protein